MLMKLADSAEKQQLNKRLSGIWFGAKVSRIPAYKNNGDIHAVDIPVVKDKQPTRFSTFLPVDPYPAACCHIAAGR